MFEHDEPKVEGHSECRKYNIFSTQHGCRVRYCHGLTSTSAVSSKSKSHRPLDVSQAEINTLNSDISKLSKKISGLSAAIQKAEAKREAEHEIYVEKEADASGAISAVERALEALKSSKGNMGGKTAMENLLQVRSDGTGTPDLDPRHLVNWGF